MATNTTSKLKAAMGVAAPVQTAPAAQAPKTLISTLLTPAFQSQMRLALPKALSPERLTRIIMTECRKVPKLLNCNPESFFGAVMQCAQLGLEPGSAMGHCYLLPYGNGKDRSGRPNCQLIIGYRGMIDLARRSGQIVSINAYEVHEADEFHYELGLHPDIRHVPANVADRGPITYVYAVAQLKGGGVQFEVMSRAEIESVRASSKAKDGGPWFTHWSEMAKKGLALDTPIPTAAGWTTMKDLSVGDKVFDKDGKQTTVTAVSDIKHIKCFRVIFSNGNSVVCDDEHRWLARSRSNSHGVQLPFNVMTVNEMKALKDRGEIVTVPVHGALDLPPVDVPIDPYLLGYWLGDGTSRSAKITCDKCDLDHVKAAVKRAGFDVGTIYDDGRSNAVDVGVISGLATKLRELDLLQNKHVPTVYLRGSVMQRKAILAGLLDSDGHCSKDRGRASFCSTNKGLRDAVAELVSSLGEVVHIREYLAKGFGSESMAYTVEWLPSFNPFTLPRKAANYRPRKIAPYIGVKEIVEVPSVATKCISVSSPTETYLCGKDMAVTHNTVVRRLFKYLPVSIEAAAALEAEESDKAVTADDVAALTFIEKGGTAPEMPAPEVVDAETGEVIAETDAAGDHADGPAPAPEVPEVPEDIR